MNQYSVILTFYSKENTRSATWSYQTRQIVSSDEKINEVAVNYQGLRI